MDPAGRTSPYSYDAAGGRTGLAYPNDTSVEYGYDVNGGVIDLTHRADLDIGWSVTRLSQVPTHPKIATIELRRHSGTRGYFLYRAVPGELGRPRP